MWSTTLVVVYCVVILAASLVGGWLPSWVRLTHTRMQVVMSFVSGLMLGVALFHMLPHSVEYLPSFDWAVGGMMVGLLTMFFLIRMFHFHQHGPEADAPTGDPALAAADDHHHSDSSCDHDHAHPPDHAHHDPAHQQPGTTPDVDHHGHRFSWAGLTLGLSLHTAIDGVALASSVAGESLHGEATWSLFGLGTFLAIVLHKPLDALSISSLMSAGGWRPRLRTLVNGGFALMCPLGALIFALSVPEHGRGQDIVIGCALAFSAGVFLCISLGDLLPEVHFHTHDRLKLSAALLLGVALAYGIELLPGHSHANRRTTKHLPSEANVFAHIASGQGFVHCRRTCGNPEMYHRQRSRRH